MNRGAGKKLVQSHSKFETIAKLVTKACDPVKPTLEKSLPKNRDNLDLAYIELCHDHRLYKADVNDDTFNAKDEDGKDKFPCNDTWLEVIEDQYCELVDKSDDKMENLATAVEQSAEESKPDLTVVKAAEELKVRKMLESQLASEKKSIIDSISLISNTVSDMPNKSIGTAQSQAIRLSVHDVSNRMDDRLQNLCEQLLRLLSETEVDKFQEEIVEFTSMQRARIDSIEMAIITKIKDAPASSSAGSFRQSGSGHTYLKKQDPPKFGGDILEFPEFKRRWASQVSCEKLEEGSELDRLRDNVPEDAKKMLVGEKSLVNAWKILTKMFGNKTMLANKLKTKLKGITSAGKQDHDVVINLAIEVKSIVNSLSEMNMQEMLKYDDEYLSAIFRALPAQEKTKWLDFAKDKFSSNWEAMENFLDGAHERATETKVLLSNYAANDQSDEASIKCRKCQEFGHKKQECPKLSPVKVAATKSSQVDNNSDAGSVTAKKTQDEKQKVKDMIGKCPHCKSYHTFKRRKDGEIWPSDRYSTCETFRKLSVKERADVLEKNGSCSRCLSWLHKKDSDTCRAPKDSCGADQGSGDKCKSDHSRFVCGSGSVYCATAKFSKSVDRSNSSDCFETLDAPDLSAETAMLLEDVKIKSGSKFSISRTLWDGGSNRVLINNEFAREQKFRSQTVTYKLAVVGGKETVEKGVIYEVDLVDNDDEVHTIWGFGLDTIMDPPDTVDLLPVRHLFPHVPTNVFQKLPQKRIDILVGLNFLSLHPDGGQGRNSIGNLKALHSRFSQGWLIAGTHPDLQSCSPKLSSSAVSIARICRVEIKPVFNIESWINVKPQYSVDFWEAENMGVLPPKRCCRCMQCPECKDAALIHSRKEQDELELLQKSIKLENKELLVSYPFIKSPECFPNNREAVLAMAKKQEVRLMKKGMLEKYNVELMKYITRGILVPISEDEMKEYMGPVNYISHHAVEKPSPTTPFRIVTNSSLKNGVRSLNDCLPKGPNSLNSMFDISVRFRAYETGLVFDLTKAYNSLKTGLPEKHLRRMLWRFSPDEAWQDFGFVVVAFGDRPAANFLELGKDLTADAGIEIDPVASKKIKRDSYVDDGVTGGSKAEVERMMGTSLGNGNYSGTICQIFEKGPLRTKVIVASGEKDTSAKDLLGNTVLGYHWDATTDLMSVLLPINTSGRIRKMKPKPDITVETLQLLETTKFTKKICLSITNGFMDFLGIGCPFTLRFKLLMKQIFDDKEIMTWNDDINDESKQAWIELIKEAVFGQSICFPRTTRPTNAMGGPSLVAFSDGSFTAFSAAVYLRWQVQCAHKSSDVCDGDFSSRLICAKARVTPLTGLTVPRSELSGLLLASRLSLTVAKALSKEISLLPIGAVLLSDSECSISALDKSSSALKPYFHNRVMEIRENLRGIGDICEVEEVFHVPGELNIADLATHPGANLTELGPNSLWQRGPAFLSCRRDLWPVTRDFVKVDLPDEELRSKTNFYAAVQMEAKAGTVALRVAHRVHSLGTKISHFTGPNVWDAIVDVLEYSNSLKKVLSILARVTRSWKHGKDLDIASKDPTAPELLLAERLVLLSAMPATFTAFEEGKLDSLMPVKEGLIIVTTGRIGEQSLSRLLGVSSLPILMPNTRSAYLFMMRAHCGEADMAHKSPVETLARSRSCVWIVRGKNLARAISKNCPLCIRKRKILCKQQMAKIKPENLIVCRPWTYISLDFAGPVVCKGVVNARARRKCWVLVYVCRSTKAVCLLATAGYDTASFLLRHEEFVARKSAPKEIVSDQGSQLLAAGDIIAKKEFPGNWDWDQVQRENNNSEWVFVPAGSQHHNGLPEAMVKVMKTSLSQALNPGVVLAYDELVTLLARISCSINSRPLGLANTSYSDQQEDILLPITPNHMLLGRSSPESPPLQYSENDKFCQRLAYIAAVEQDWWTRWIKTVLPTMLPAGKWKKEEKNLKVDDVVLLTFPGNVKDDYILAIVTQVHPDAKNLVRRVTVKYRRKNSKEAKDVCKSKMEEKIVAVQRLVLLESAPIPSTSTAPSPSDLLEPAPVTSSTSSTPSSPSPPGSVPSAQSAA